MTCWLLNENKAYFGSISGTKVYASAYHLGWLKWLKISKNGLHYLLSVVLSRISLQSIFKQVLGLWITIPENFPNSVKVSKMLLTEVYYFLQDFCLFIV